jgi:O-antigen/teichoic acid export membrane protein/2-polyprenyl-3-methyl-5-hydroxy-6-metoxy-1,4-benzoquinol methylase
MRDGIVNYSGVLASGLVGLILVPALYHGLAGESYGVWIAALAVAGIASGLDLGIGWSLIREVAARKSRPREEFSAFVRTAANVYLAVGLTGGVLIATMGLPLSVGLHLSSSGRSLAHIVFGFVGVSFLGEQIITFASGILQGLRRFGVNNSVAVAAAVFRSGGIIALLWRGKGLTTISIWYAGVTAILALLSLVIVGRLLPGIPFRPGQFDWGALRAHLPFSVASQLASAGVQVVWNGGPLLIGLFSGSASIVPYYIGQRFPLALSGLTWRVAEVLYPAASEHGRAQDKPLTRQVLEVGTRWSVVLAFPIALVLVIVAPSLLRVWLGDVRPVAVLVLRLTALAVLVDSFGVAGLHVLWGRGQARSVLAVEGAAGLATVLLTMVLLPAIGIVGAAWAILGALTIGAVASIYLATKACAVKASRLLGTTVKGLAVPVLAGATGALAVVFMARSENWGMVAATSILGGTAYAAALYFTGAREEERVFFREIAVFPAMASRAALDGLHRLLRRVSFVRSGVYLAIALADWARNPSSSAATFDREFRHQRDPWGYDKLEERARFQRALEFLDTARGTDHFQRALEIGCAEGAFTELLMPRCDSLLAVDWSSLALERARERRPWNESVRFERWDLRKDPLPGLFDLIVVMSVLEYFARPGDLRAARDKLAAGLMPGGYLLLGNVRQSDAYETAWWGKYLVRGGKWMNQLVSQGPGLRLEDSAMDSHYVITLLRKVA